jgi:hypothetical protein
MVVVRATARQAAMVAFRQAAVVAPGKGKDK